MQKENAEINVVLRTENQGAEDDMKDQMLKQTLFKSMWEQMWWIGDPWGCNDEQSGGNGIFIYCVKSWYSLIYNTMAKMAMKDKKTENSRGTTAATLRRLWSYRSHLIWIHAVKQVSFSFLFDVQNAIELFIYLFILLGFFFNIISFLGLNIFFCLFWG